MIHTACLDVGGALTTSASGRQWASAPGFYPLCWAQHLTSNFQFQKTLVIQFLLHLGSTGEIAKMMPKFRQDPNFNSWLDNCLALMPPMQLAAAIRMPIHRAKQGQSTMGLYQP